MLRPRLRSLTYGLLTLITLSACANTSRHTQPSPLPLHAQAPDKSPDDRHVKAAISEYFKLTGAPLYSRYNFIRTDLNDDGLMDALIHMKAPYGHWCGANGCTVIALLAHHESFQVVGNISPVRTPIYLSNTRTHGLKDLITHHSGDMDKARNITLKFDGRTYPFNPLEVQTYTPVSTSDLQKIFP